MASYSLQIVNQNDLTAVLPHVFDFLMDALAEDDNTISYEDLISKLYLGEKKLFVLANDLNKSIHAAIVTEFCIINYQKRLLIRLLGGKDMKDWLDLIDQFVGFAEANECKYIMLCGRRGWKKLLKPYGYQEKGTIFSMKLNKEI